MTAKLYEFVAPSVSNMQVSKPTEEDKCWYMSGIFVQGDKQNHNKRVYPVNEIASAVSSINEKINSGFSVLGELDHPEELTINLDRVSHAITEMQIVGSDGFGKMKILPTPMGQIASALLSSGTKLGVSSRGSGNVSDYGYVSDYEIVTVDIVAQPSAPDAYPKSIYESLYNMRGCELIIDLAENVNNDERAEHYLMRDINKLINELRK